MIETLTQLAAALRAMSEGQRMIVERVTFTSLWPRPPFPKPDDWLEDRERGQRWCTAYGCTVWEQFDPAGLAFEKARTEATASNSSEEFGSQEHSVVMDAILGRSDY